MDKEEEIASLKKQLQQSRDSFELFAYTVSHDMREPVRMVKSFMDLLMRKYSSTLDDKAKSYVDYASDGAGRADLMIQDLLFYYRSVRGLESGPVDLNQAFVAATEKLKQKADTRIIDISCPELPAVMGDVAGYREVFIYLMEHLLQRIPLSVQPLLEFVVTEDGRNWVISCTSNGTPLEQGELRDLFKLFYNRAQQQSADSTLNKLAVAKRIVEHLNGELLAEETSTGAVVYKLILPAVGK